MSAVLTLVTDGAFGTKPANALFVTRATLAGDTSYPTGGYDLDALLDVKDVMKDHKIIAVIAENDGNYNYSFDYVNVKLKFLTIGTDAEVTNGTDVAAVTALPLVIISQ